MIYTKEIQNKGSFDIIVCGGGFSGFSAAYAAAREGANVLLIERNGCLGGVGTQGLVNHILGERLIDNYQFHTCIGDIFDKIEQAILKDGAGVDVNTIDLDLNPHGWKQFLASGLIFDNEKMKLLLEEMLCEVGVKILYMTDVVDVIKENDRLTSIVVHNKSGLYSISGKYFVDATGDADICEYAGCKVFKGDENGGMAAASLEMHVENVDLDVLSEYMRKTGDLRFVALINDLKANEEWHFPYDIFISVMLTQDDVFMINTIRQVGIDGTNADSLTKGIIDGRKENFELLKIMKKYFPGFKNARIRQIAPVIGIRETNRILGEYTLTVEDLITAKDFEDGIALSAYGWDLPNPKHPSHQPFEGVKRKSKYTQIPYRCLVPKGLDNVIVAGRCISVEREVLGPVRVMGPCIAMGCAAGIASAMALSDGMRYIDVDEKTLRNKIVDHGGFVDRNQIQ